MSIATLKRKTKYTVQASLGNGQTSFSLNGTYRNQGYVGQTTLSRSLPMSTMKGGDGYSGHGGCCGTFEIKPLIQSAIYTTENNTVVKPSVMNTNGMIHTKYPWIWRSYPVTSVKPDTTQNTNTQQQYIDNIHRCTVATISKMDASYNNTGNTTPSPSCNTTNMHLNDKNKFDYLLNLTKNIEGRGGVVAMDQGEYIALLSGNCNNRVSTKPTASGCAGCALPGPSSSH